MAFVATIAKSVFSILHSFFASLGKLLHGEESPEWSAQHQMKIRKNFGLSGALGIRPGIGEATCEEGSPSPGKVC